MNYFVSKRLIMHEQVMVVLFQYIRGLCVGFHVQTIYFARVQTGAVITKRFPPDYHLIHALLLLKFT